MFVFLKLELVGRIGDNVMDDEDVGDDEEDDDEDVENNVELLVRILGKIYKGYIVYFKERKVFF